ncbi:MAG: glycosyltransferase family 4 protein [Candidatus Magasanikbacteria bacterium]|nr:glycosyltransferase family 4 protein [Candidatus Magasanikbacteria bacterium]
MNIGIDIRPLMSPARSGVGEYTYELVDALLKIDTKNHYFLFYNSYKNTSHHIPTWNQANVHYVHKKWPNKFFNIAIKIFGIPHIDSIIKKTVNPPLSHELDYFFSPNFGFSALGKKTKHILTVHDLSFEFFPEFFSFKQKLWHWAINPKRQCQNAHLILTPSENTKRDIISRYQVPAEKIKVIYPGISCHRTQNSEQPETQKLDILQKYNLPHNYLLFLGTAEPRKNIIGLIEAFEKASQNTILPKSSTPYSLVITGYKGWKDKKIYQKFLSSPIKERIKFIGPVEATDKPALYAASTLFIYPSFYEGFGFPVAEAMACGTPVITSNRSSLPEISGSSAFLINPNRPSELADAIAKMLNEKTLREHFKNSGLEQSKKFNWEKSAQEFLSTLQHAST